MGGSRGSTAHVSECPYERSSPHGQDELSFRIPLREAVASERCTVIVTLSHDWFGLLCSCRVRFCHVARLLFSLIFHLSSLAVLGISAHSWSSICDFVCYEASYKQAFSCLTSQLIHSAHHQRYHNRNATSSTMCIQRTCKSECELCFRVLF